MTREPYRVWIGWDPAEVQAYAVARQSLLAHTNAVVHPRPICRESLLDFYTRLTETRQNRLWDTISDAPMSTDHAIARFFVPFLCGYAGWALFVDGDVLFRADVKALFAEADERYAVQVVQHPPLLEEGFKKDGAVQQPYPRKNWSSVILWNCKHPQHAKLTREILNTWPGRDLHRFGWLSDDAIGSLSPHWNHLVGVSPMTSDPALVHFTLGTPDLVGDGPFSTEWWDVAATCGVIRAAG